MPILHAFNYTTQPCNTPLEILLGVFMFVYDEMDDSPGEQLLGFVAVVLGVMGIIKSRKRELQTRRYRCPIFIHWNM